MPASSDTLALAKRLSGKQLINGQLVAPKSGKVFPVLNPATGENCAEAAHGDAADVDSAVQAAAKTQKDWARKPARERGKLISEVARLITAHGEELAQLMVLETGKAIRTECRIEVGAAADIWTFYGGLGSELKGETVPFRPEVLVFTQHEPIGVVGAIIPWNVPLLLLALKVCPALVAGNSIVVKSAEEAPLTVLRVAELAQQVLPPGIFNMLSGFGPDCGGPLVEHPLVRKVSFTGSVETGKIIARAAAEKLIPTTLELGGNSPMIIMQDADFDRTVQGAVIGVRFTRQGQSCTCASRIFVHRSLHDEFVKRLKAKVDAMKIGDPFDDATDIGSIISPQQFERVQSYVEIGEKIPGSMAHRCGQMPKDPKLAQGLFTQPVIFTGLTNDSKLAREEIFGPVTCVIPFDDFEEALRLANDTEYGLAATIWTKDLKSAMQAAQRLEAGFVQVNQNLVVQANLSYGGFKNSGIGKEASLEAMLEHFTKKKTVLVNME
ncbi:MAG: aldehyde dehydrogenase family protein [Alphaproteobacteria bacterium]|nr:aldehyde dehydrogenase family protein [Alphaproteobacteria bacterium]